MEIEAKFLLPNAEAFSGLLSLNALPPYDLEPTRHLEITDGYLDTETGTIIGSGRMLRERQYRNGGVVYTLKWGGDVRGALHRRNEVELELEQSTEHTSWPECELGKLVTGMIGAGKLSVQFGIEQDRHVRDVTRDGEPVAELCLDSVRMEDGTHTRTWDELEIELKGSGTGEDITRIVASLGSFGELVPQGISKFEQALAFFGPPVH